MGKYIYDNVLHLYIVPTLSSMTAPSLAQVLAGTQINAFLRSMDTPFEGSSVDSSTADSAYNTTILGTYGGQNVMLECTKDKIYASDVAFNALARATVGKLVIGRRGGSGANNALAVGDRVDVWSYEVATRNLGGYTRNSLVVFSAQLSVPAAPTEDVVLAA